MAKKKQAPALFEVISKGLENRPGAEADAPAESVQDVAQASPPEPLARAQEKRLHLSLNYVSCSVSAIGLAVLLGGAFVLGRMTAPETDGAGADTSLGVSPYRPDVLNRPATPAPVRETGKYYLIVQGVGGVTERHKSAALAIARYLNAIGEPVDVGVYKGSPRQYIVWSLNGFASPDDEDAIKFAKTIETIGKKYRQQGGEYDFRQRGRDGQFRPWFYQYHK